MSIALLRRRSFDLSPRAVHLFLVIAIVLIVGVVAALARATWMADTARASAEANNLAVMVEQDVRRNLDLYDLSIQGAREAVMDPAVMQAPRDLRDRLLFDRAATASYLGEIMVIDPDGNVVASSRGIGAEASNQSDRDYFRIHALDPTFGLYVSRPLVSRSDGQQVIALSRRITQRDGRFGGVIVGTLRVEYLRHLFHQMKLGSRGSLALLRIDGSMMMREPFVPALVGTRQAWAPLFDRVSRSSDGEFTGLSPIDGEWRLFRYRRLGRLPLIVNVGLSMRDVRAGWWHGMVLVAGIVGLCCGSIIFVTLQLGRELRRRNEAEAALRALVDTDSLTGLANRRCFDRVLDAAWRLSKDTGKPLSMLMIDADHFKQFNDKFGHLAGDEALRQIGRCLVHHAYRPGSLAARYGGEEFALVLPDVDGVDALRLADAVRRSIEALGIAHPTSPLGVFTVSIGCATLDFATMAKGEDLATAADIALYRSKRSGRNLASQHKKAPDPLPLAS